MQFRWLAVLGAVSILLGAASPAFAGKGDYGHYLGFRFIGSFAEVDDTKSQNFVGALQINNDTDIVAGNAFIFGYRWKSLPIRTDIEIAYRYRFDHDLRDTGLPVRGYENNLATLSGLVNLTYEYRNATSFTPYFGGGVGWAQKPFQRSAVRSIKWRRAKFRRKDAQFCMGRTSWRYPAFRRSLGYRSRISFHQLRRIGIGRTQCGWHFYGG